MVHQIRPSDHPKVFFCLIITEIPLFLPFLGKTGECFDRSIGLFPSKGFENAK